MGPEGVDDPAYPALAWQLEMYKYLELLYAQHELAVQRHEELQQENDRLQGELDLFRSAGPAETKPYSFLLVDDLRDQWAMEQSREETVRDEIEAAQALLASVQEKHEDSETQRRQAQEQAEGATEPRERASLQARVQQARLLSQITLEALTVRKLDVESARQKQAITVLRRQLLEERLVAMTEDVEFTAQDLANKLSSLDNDEQEVRAKIDEAQTSFR